MSVATAAPAGLYFIHTDHLNTPRLITNEVKQTAWASDDPFGNNAPNENPSGLGTFTCNLRLPGQYFDQETNDYSDQLKCLGEWLSQPLADDLRRVTRADVDLYQRYVQTEPIGVETRAPRLRAVKRLFDWSRPPVSDGRAQTRDQSNAIWCALVRNGVFRCYVNH